MLVFWSHSESCATASPKWPYFSTWQCFCKTSHSSYLTKSIFKEVETENHCFVVQPCKIHFSLALFKTSCLQCQNLWSSLIVSTFLSSALSCKLNNKDFTPQAAFEGRVWSECVSNGSGHSGFVYVCVLVEGMLCNLWPAGEKWGVFQHCGVKLSHLKHTYTYNHSCFCTVSVWRTHQNEKQTDSQSKYTDWWGVEMVIQTM